MDLEGISVVITRAPHQAGELKHLIEEKGGRAILFPTIEIRPADDFSGCDRAIDGLYMYDGLLFSSPNGVTGFMERAKERGVDAASLKEKRIYAVGRVTAEALAVYGVAVTAMPDRFTGADLARTIQSEDLKGRAFIFPTGNLTSTMLADTVRQLGGSVDTVMVYTSSPPRGVNVGEFLAEVRAGRVDVVTFTSPSTVKNFAGLFSAEDAAAIRDRVHVAVIGPTTARAAGEAGFPPDIVPEQSTASDLVEALCRLRPRASSPD
jgi:uroporphyrinogen-III synthase